VAVFLVGVVGAMVITQHLRSEGPTAEHILLHYKPDQPARVCFETPRDDTFQVAMVDIDDRAVRILAKGRRLEGDPTLDRSSRHCFNWDLLDDSGERVPPGAYRLRLSLRDADRTAISGERMIVPPPPDEGSP
jgi:hypothetical protein